MAKRKSHRPPPKSEKGDKSKAIAIIALITTALSLVRELIELINSLVD